MLLVATSVVVAYCALEIAYRIYQYETLPDRLFRLGLAESQKRGPGQAIFDEHTGFRSAPHVEGRSQPPFNGHWRTNSYGHVSEVEYPRQKPPDEYRIAVVGDSMTANTLNNVRWTELVERQLNASPTWRASVGGRPTRVINFAMPMIGFVQFAALVRYDVFDFDPDLIIVNFISDDVRRRLFFPVPPAPTPDINERLRLFIETNILYQMRWFRPWPELFAATIGRLWNMRCHLPLDDRLIWSQSVNITFTEKSEAIAAGAVAIRDMLALARAHDRPILFLWQPEVDELDGTARPRGRGLVEDLQTAVPEFSFANMQPRMAALLDGKRLEDRPDLAGLDRDSIARLPDGRKLEVYRWFYVPDDPHYTDYGTTLYGEQVTAYLIERSATGVDVGSAKRP